MSSFCSEQAEFEKRIKIFRVMASVVLAAGAGVIATAGWLASTYLL